LLESYVFQGKAMRARVVSMSAFKEEFDSIIG